MGNFIAPAMKMIIGIVRLPETIWINKGIYQNIGGINGRQ